MLAPEKENVVRKDLSYPVPRGLPSPGPGEEEAFCFCIWAVIAGRTCRLAVCWRGDQGKTVSLRGRLLHVCVGGRPKSPSACHCSEWAWKRIWVTDRHMFLNIHAAFAPFSKTQGIETPSKE
jgi:hypothetical protein